MLVAYYVLRWAFISQSEGLITPEQSVALWPLALGAATIVGRLLGLFVVLPTCAYWLVSDLAHQITTRRR
jgi:hypothetical protein